MAFHSFTNPDGEPYGSFETFHSEGIDDRQPNAGWYWWPCFPGCLPDCDWADGPYLTEQDALEAADEDRF